MRKTETHRLVVFALLAVFSALMPLERLAQANGNAPSTDTGLCPPPTNLATVAETSTHNLSVASAASPDVHLSIYDTAELTMSPACARVDKDDRYLPELMSAKQKADEVKAFRETVMTCQTKAQAAAIQSLLGDLKGLADLGGGLGLMVFEAFDGLGIPHWAWNAGGMDFDGMFKAVEAEAKANHVDLDSKLHPMRDFVTKITAKYYGGDPVEALKGISSGDFVFKALGSGMQPLADKFYGGDTRKLAAGIASGDIYVQAASKIPDMTIAITHAFSSKWDEFKCMKPSVQARMVCEKMGQIGYLAVTTVVGGQVVDVAKAVVQSPKIAEAIDALKASAIAQKIVKVATGTTRTFAFWEVTEDSLKLAKLGESVVWHEVQGAGAVKDIKVTVYNGRTYGKIVHDVDGKEVESIYALADNAEVDAQIKAQVAAKEALRKQTAGATNVNDPGHIARVKAGHDAAVAEAAQKAAKDAANRDAENFVPRRELAERPAHVPELSDGDRKAFAGRLGGISKSGEELVVLQTDGSKLAGKIRSVDTSSGKLVITVEDSGGVKHVLTEGKDLDASATYSSLKERQAAKAAEAKAGKPSKEKEPPETPAAGGKRAPAPDLEPQFAYSKQAAPLPGPDYVGKSSFAHKYPELAKDLDGVNREIFDVDGFVRDFKAANGGASPTVGDVARYHLERRQAMVKRLEALGTKYKGDPTLADSLQQARDEITVRSRDVSDLKKDLAGNPEFKKPFDPHNHEQGELIKAYQSKALGEIGELDAVARFDHVEQRGMKFNTEHPTTAHQAEVIAEIKSKSSELGAIFADPAKLDELRAKYPRIFRDDAFPKAKGGAPASLAERMKDPGYRESAVKKLTEWFKSKEMDVVHKLPDGRTGWIEVKNYRQKVTLDTLLESKGGSKSIFEQAQEAREMRDFLTSESKVKLEFYSPRGVDDAARAKLASIGVTVVP